MKQLKIKMGCCYFTCKIHAYNFVSLQLRVTQELPISQCCETNGIPFYLFCNVRNHGKCATPKRDALYILGFSSTDGWSPTLVNAATD